MGITNKRNNDTIIINKKSPHINNQLKEDTGIFDEVNCYKLLASAASSQAAGCHHWQSLVSNAIPVHITHINTKSPILCCVRSQQDRKSLPTISCPMPYIFHMLYERGNTAKGKMDHFRLNLVSFHSGRIVIVFSF